MARQLLFNKNTVFISTHLNPYINLSLGEYLTRKLAASNSSTKNLFLSSSHHGVFIGRNQNCWKECNMQLMKQDNVPLIRRNTGGGACYIDCGNRLFSFIEKYNGTKKNNYPIILNALHGLGFDAALLGRNDICINGKKISGSAFSITKNILKHHGTILVDMNKAKMVKYLNPNKLKLESKGIDSIEARVTNLTDYNPYMLYRTVDAAIINEFNKYHNTASDNVDIDHTKLDDQLLFNKIYQKYTSREYLYNNNPEFTHKLEHKFSFGLTEILLVCKNNIITECQIFSDSLDTEFIDKLKQVFISKEYDITLPEIIKTNLGAQYETYAGELCNWLTNNL